MAVWLFFLSERRCAACRSLSYKPWAASDARRMHGAENGLAPGFAANRPLAGRFIFQHKTRLENAICSKFPDRKKSAWCYQDCIFLLLFRISLPLSAAFCGTLGSDAKKFHLFFAAHFPSSQLPVTAAERPTLGWLFKNVSINFFILIEIANRSSPCPAILGAEDGSRSGIQAVVSPVISGSGRKR